MSVKAMSYVWEIGLQNHAELLVMLAIADYSNDRGYAWPSVKALAKKTACTERGVQKIIGRLVSIKKLSVKLNGGPKGTNLYRVIPPEHGSPIPPHVVHPPERGSGRTEKPTPRTPEHKGVNPRSPEPSGTVIRTININGASMNNQKEAEEKKPHPDMIARLHATYCHESGLELELDTATGNDRWGRKRAWHDFLKDGFTEVELVQVIKHIRRTLKDPFKTKSLNFRKLIVGNDFFGEQLAEATRDLRTAKRPQTNREEIMKATNRLVETIPDPKTPKGILPDPENFAKGMDELRKSLK